MWCSINMRECVMLKEGATKTRNETKKREGVIITNDFMSEIYQSKIMQCRWFTKLLCYMNE